MITKKIIQRKINEELKKQIIQEKLDPKDYSELRDFIRHEVAVIFFDLFKKRSTWF